MAYSTRPTLLLHRGASKKSIAQLKQGSCIAPVTKNCATADPTYLAMQKELRERQVWMGQLLDFMFKHGGLNRDVSKPLVIMQSNIANVIP